MERIIQLKHSLIYMLPKGITGFFPVLALVVYTRFLTKFDFGIFALAGVCAIFLGGIVNFGTVTGFNRNFFKYNHEQERRELLYSILSFVLVAFIFVAIITLIVKGILSRWIVQHDGYGDVIFILFCSTVFANLNQYFFFYFRNDERAKTFVLYTSVFSFLNVAIPVILIVFIHLGLMGLVFGQLIAGSIIFIFLGFKFLREVPYSFNPVMLKEVLIISYPLTPRIFFGVINSQISNYILAVMNTVGGVGLFSIGQRISNFIFVFMTTIQNVFNPYVYKKLFSGAENAGAEIGKYLTPFLYFSVALGLLFALFAKELLCVFTARSFHAAAGVLTVLSIYYSMLFFGKITGLQIIFKKKTYLVSVMTLFTIGLNVLIAIPLAKHFGAIGAAWALLIVGVIASATSFTIAQRLFYIKWEYKKVISMFCILIFSSALILLSENYHVPYLYCLVFKCLALLIYLYVGISIKIITKENLIMLKDVVTLKA